MKIIYKQLKTILAFTLTLFFIQANAQVALLGVGAYDQLDEDVKTAYDWAQNNYEGTADYYSFTEITGDPSLLDGKSAIWWHNDTYVDLPDVATNETTVALIKNFRSEGGGLLLTGLATQYVVNLELETTGPNEVGRSDNPAPNPDPWGFLAKEPDHPVFEGLTNPFFTLYSETGLREDVKAWWVIANDPIEDVFHGKYLASAEWDAEFSILVSIAEYEGYAGQGNTIAVGAGAYDWYLEEGENTKADTLQMFTTNCLDYVQQPNPQQFVLLGTGETVDDLEADVKEAYNWALAEYPDDVQYKSFTEIANDPASIENVNMAWWHSDTNLTLPPAATDQVVVDALNNMKANGGGILLTGLATQYVVDLGVETTGPNEVGHNPDPQPNPDPWGFLAKQPDHPIFNSLTNPFFTLYSETGLREDSKAWWVIANDPIEDVFHGTYLASAEWDSEFSILVSIGEYKGAEGEGNVVAIGAGAYDWYLEEGSNTKRDTLEMLTKNCFEYLKIPAQEVIEPELHVSIEGGEIMEGEEDGKILDVTLTDAEFVAELNMDNWTIENLPPGVSASVERVDEINATITLTGTAEDYDQDITNFTVKVMAEEFVSLDMEYLESVGEVIFNAINEYQINEGKIVLVGDKETMSELDPDEAAAYNWALDEFGEDASYHSFTELVNDTTLLDSIDAVWWHYDKYPDLPLSAVSPNTIEIMQEFRANGGGIFLTGFATQYVVDLGVETTGPNEVGKAEEPFTNPDPWGFRANYPDHPAFMDLDNPFYTLNSENGLREDVKAWWVIANDPIDDVFHGKYLASVDWDSDFSVLVTIAEYEGAFEEGNVIAIGAGAYDWYLENGTNDNIGQLQTLSFNCLNYLKLPHGVGIEEQIDRSMDIVTYPNPFTESVQFNFTLEDRSEVTLEIFDMQGRTVNTLLKETMQPGTYSKTWRPDERYSSGIYFYRIKAGMKVANGKLIMQ
ncbi:MAG: DUF4960 domain-containing protein [Bacteroidales bacterium]|nr:DUF4960 domain-containing protein [Bacteroidales bacterium]